ncbi:MAG: hypothetical protein Sv326_0123 [Candidatus Fermentimicrarchaeum limneticum]|uniref:EamA domain-containing protein n=1 Tax=Fermentimicrarchaeum limneticum TaxID=2795018 RepID=A0A7D6BLG4_FERL1|nr:MAG: hypothetical protein Sv326_0123 [Candidatus Fermentimicrarchaeum limneticum]
MDWRTAAIITMLALGVYNILVQMFVKEVDWRVMIPIVFVVSLALLIYFFFSYPLFIDTVTPGSVLLAFSLAIIFVISTVFTYLSYKEGGPISAVVPIFSLSMFVSVLISVAFLKEEMNLITIAGMLFSFIGMVLLVYK